MKNYLVLIYNQYTPPSDLTDRATFNYYKQWGKYLAKFNSNNALIKGSSLSPSAFSLSKDGGLTSVHQAKNPLKGYFLLEAKNMEALKNHLLGCPVFENETAKVVIHEIDFTGKI